MCSFCKQYLGVKRVRYCIYTFCYSGNISGTYFFPSQCQKGLSNNSAHVS